MNTNIIVVIQIFRKCGTDSPNGMKTNTGWARVTFFSNAKTVSKGFRCFIWCHEKTTETTEAATTGEETTSSAAEDTTETTATDETTESTATDETTESTATDGTEETTTT